MRITLQEEERIDKQISNGEPIHSMWLLKAILWLIIVIHAQTNKFSVYMLPISRGSTPNLRVLSISGSTFTSWKTFSNELVPFFLFYTFSYPYLIQYKLLAFRIRKTFFKKHWNHVFYIKEKVSKRMEFIVTNSV